MLKKAKKHTGATESSADAIEQVEAASKPEIGELFRAKREAKKLTEREVAQRTSIREAYIVAMEENHLDKLPGTFFVKAYTSAYIKFLKISDKDLEKYSIPEVAEKPQNSPSPLMASSRQDSLFLGKKTLWLSIALTIFVVFFWLSPKKDSAPVVAKVTKEAAVTPVKAQDLGSEIIIVVSKDMRISLLETDGRLYEIKEMKAGQTHFVPLNEPLIIATDSLQGIEIFIKDHQIDTTKALAKKDNGWLLDIKAIKASLKNK